MTPSLATREELEQRERLELLPLATFSDSDHERPQPEPLDPFRTCFVRDRDRVLHCGAFRRLKDKTQVFVIDEGDFYRTRLTHTLEVAQLARYLCRALRLNESLTEVLALVHDIGHPPFGHEGERILNGCARVPFDHNRQALRIVDVLESPYTDRRGLNLTQLTRRMILKHGGAAGHGAEPTVGHVLEAQVSDLADSVAYQHHDLEDGLRARILTREELEDLPIWRESREEVGAVPLDHRGSKAILNHMLKASLQDILEVSSGALATTDAAEAGDVARSPEALVRFSPQRAEQHEELGRFLYERFYRHPRVLRSSRVAQDALAAIVDHYGRHPQALPTSYRQRLDGDGVERSVCDYVAGMTDRYAIDEWQRLGGRRGVQPRTNGAPVDIDLTHRVALLQETIGYDFHDTSLAITALTHASARTDAMSPNERLEFLGDSVLGLVVGRLLYLRFPDQPEGELSRIKSAAVSRNALSQVAEGWELATLLVLGPGFRVPEDIPPSLTADAVEAVLGAVFLDGGLDEVDDLIVQEFGPIVEASAGGRRSRNGKSELQAFTQGELGFTPHYQVMAEEGPDHRKLFTVAAVVGGVQLSAASGRNKRQAEQRAAMEALGLLRAAAEGLAELPGGLKLSRPPPTDREDTSGADDP